MYLDVKPKRKDNMDARKQAQQLAGMGRYGDTMLMHVNPKEVQGIASVLPITTNPQTGQPEMFIGALLGSILGSTFLPGLAGGTALGAAGAGAIGSALGTWAETGDLEKGIMSGIMGYGLGSVFGEIGSGSEVLGEIASEESLKAAALQTPPPTDWVARKVAETAGEEVSTQAMSDWLAQSGTERLGDIGRNLFSENTLTALGENYLPIALGGGSLGAQEAQEQFEREMAEWRAGKGKRREELLAKYPEQISPRSPYYQPPLYGAQGGQIPQYQGGTQILTDPNLYPWMTSNTGGDQNNMTNTSNAFNQGNNFSQGPVYTPPAQSVFANAPTGSVLERFNQAQTAGLPTTTTLKSPFAESGLAPWQMAPIPQTDDEGEIVYDDEGEIVYEAENPYLYGPEGQLIPPKTYMPGIDPEFNFFPGRVRTAGSIGGGGAGTGGGNGGGGGDDQTGAGGTDDTSFQEYINNLLLTGGYSSQDLADYIGSIGPDVSGFMTDEAFQEWLQSYQPDFDMSDYMTGGDFQEWLTGQDFSQYATDQDFQDWFDQQDFSQYQNQDFQNWYDQFDWDQFATDQDFQNWMDDMDWDQFATNQDFQDWLNNQDWDQYQTFDPSNYDWQNIFDQYSNQDFQDWFDQQDFSQFDPSGYDWQNIFDQYGFDPSDYYDPQDYMTNQDFQQWVGGQDWSRFDPTTYDWSSIFDQFMNQNSPDRDPVDNSGGDQMAMQGGGQIEEDVVIIEARMAVLGQHQNPDQAIQAFIEKYGVDAFLQLRDSVLQQQVPNAQTEGIISGQGGGMDDMVNGMIGNRQGIAVSPGEYIVPADVVSMLGDGSSDSGADKLDVMLEKVRVNKTGTTVQAEEIDEQEVLPT